MKTWGRVPSEVAKFAHVVTYDRAGLGRSDPGPTPRTSQQIVDELHALLTRADVPGPYVLVGHSFGGLNVQLYASQHPDQVAGIVLIDSSHEEQIDRIAALLTPEEREAFYRKKQCQNYEKVDLLESAAQVRAAGLLPSVPCVVLTAGRCDWSVDLPIAQLEQIRHDLQKDLARRIPASQHIIVEDSGHFIHCDRPDLVVAAIRTVVEEAQRRSGGS
jgi:pimeloyl-ACP methyl ester carboxylesterase